jgi:hypothetical protein
MNLNISNKVSHSVTFTPFHSIEEKRSFQVGISFSKGTGRISLLIRLAKKRRKIKELSFKTRK